MIVEAQPSFSIQRNIEAHFESCRTGLYSFHVLYLYKFLGFKLFLLGVAS